jgi:hypothetical protein
MTARPGDDPTPPPTGKVQDGWEESRLANLLHFASLTPTQRVRWLGEMLELVGRLRGAAGAPPADRETGVAGP